MKSSGTNGASSVAAAASARRGPGRRSSQAIAERAVADLIVVLGAHDEALPGQPGGGAAVAVPAELRVTAGVDEAVAERGARGPRPYRSRRSSRSRSPVSSACSAWWKSSFHCASQPMPPRCFGLISRASLAALSAINQMWRPACSRVRVDRVDELVHEGIRARVGDRVHRVEAQRVDAEVGDPLERVLDEEVAHLVGAGSVVVERVAPRRAVARR